MESFPRDGKKSGIKRSSDPMFEEHVKSKKHKIQKMKLRIVDEEMKQVNFSFGEMVKGIVTEADNYSGIHLKIQKEGKVVTGFLPVHHMAPCGRVAKLLAQSYVPGDVITAFVFAIKPTLILSSIFLKHYGGFDSLKVGDCIPCSLYSRTEMDDGVKVILPIENYSKPGFVSYKNAVSNVKDLRENKILLVKITAINAREKELALTMKDIWESPTEYEIQMMASIDTLSLYFNKLVELEKRLFYQEEKKPISSVVLGRMVFGVVRKVTKDGLMLELPNKLIGMVRKAHCLGRHEIGELVCGTVLWKNYNDESVEVSLLKKIVHSIRPNQEKIREFPTGTLLKAEILLITNWLILVSVKFDHTRYLAALPVRRHVNDNCPDLTPYKILDKIQVYVIKKGNECDILPICMLKSAFEKSKNTVTMELSPNNQLQEKNGIEEEEEEEKESTERLCVPQCGFSWDDKANLDNFVYNTKIFSDKEKEPDEDSKRKQKRKKLCAAEREQKQQEKLEIHWRAEALANKMANNRAIDSIDDFNKLVLLNSNSSLVWLQYMAYHLQTKEIDKARAVARRAIKTINFTEENEQLNVWNAWLNLESKYGTAESLNHVFQKAVKTNDAYKVYMHMLTVHASADRKDELVKLFGIVIGMFKQEAQTWTCCGNAFVEISTKDEMGWKERQIHQREVLKLRQRAKALACKASSPISKDDLDSFVLSNPDNSLVWIHYIARSLYGTVVTKGIDRTRAVARQAIEKINFRKENERLNVWKAWLNLESRYGTAESLNDVFQEAVKANDVYKIYLHMLTVHATTNRKDELLKLIGTLLDKFKQKSEMWRHSGIALKIIGMKERQSSQVRQLTNQLQTHSQSRYVKYLELMANLTYKWDGWRDVPLFPEFLWTKDYESLFENITKPYNTRFDYWSSALDDLIECVDPDLVRKVLEQLRTRWRTLPCEKRRILLIKFENFEKKYGTPEAVNRISRKYLKYVVKDASRVSEYRLTILAEKMKFTNC